MEPKYLVLDEPTAGLDPRGRDDLLQRIVRLHREKKMTVIFVSHNMDDIARLADRVIFMHEGRVLLDAPPREAFREKLALKTAGLEEPETVTLLEKLQQRGLAVDTDAFTAEETARRIIRALRKRGGGRC